MLPVDLSKAPLGPFFLAERMVLDRGALFLHHSAAPVLAPIRPRRRPEKITGTAPGKVTWKKVKS